MIKRETYDPLPFKKRSAISPQIGSKKRLTFFPKEYFLASLSGFFSKKSIAIAKRYSQTPPVTNPEANKTKGDQRILLVWK